MEEQRPEECKETSADISASPKSMPPGYRPGHYGGMLAPKWQKGQSGNPSGLTKDGRPTRTAAIENELERQLNRRGATKKLVSAWLRQANRGSPKHLELILDRRFPVLKESTEGREILEGIKLELSEGGASATLLRRSVPSNGALDGHCDPQ